MKSFRIASWLTVAVLALGVSGARADDRPVGVVQTKNLVQSTVTIDDQVYRVTSATRILNGEGRRMQLSQVETEADFGDLVPLDRVTYAYAAQGDVLSVLEAVNARD